RPEAQDARTQRPILGGHLVDVEAAAGPKQGVRLRCRLPGIERSRQAPGLPGLFLDRLREIDVLADGDQDLLGVISQRQRVHVRRQRHRSRERFPLREDHLHVAENEIGQLHRRLHEREELAQARLAGAGEKRRDYRPTPGRGQARGGTTAGPWKAPARRVRTSVSRCPNSPIGWIGVLSWMTRASSTRTTATRSTPSRCAPSGVGRPMPSDVSMRNWCASTYQGCSPRRSDAARAIARSVLVHDGWAMTAGSIGSNQRSMPPCSALYSTGCQWARWATG